jgi:hypothetical protein
MTVSGSTFTGNSARAGGGGIANFGTATVSGSTFTANSARGGGILNGALGALTVSDSTFTENTASISGGGIDNFGTAMVSGSTFTGNSAASGNGGLNNEPGGLLTQLDNRFFDDLPPDVFP